MPVRFTSPGLGGQDESYLRAHQWRVGVAYRRLSADKWYVGSEVREDKAPFGQPLVLNINSLDFSAEYGLSHRFSLALTLPFSSGTQSRFYADLRRHEVSSVGLGDVNLIGTYWVGDPLTHGTGNLAVGLGVKTPTGRNHVEDDFFLADSSVVQRPVDQSVQRGDGGWGVIVQLQGFQRLLPGFYGYFLGSYLLSPRENTDVPSPVPGSPLSVPDVYSGRLGVAYSLWPSGGLSASLGGRIDGIPYSDLVTIPIHGVGGGPPGFRRPGYTVYLDPGLALTRGNTTFTLSVPIALQQSFEPSAADIATGRKGGGDLANYLVFGGINWRP
jgi:hypothetical protein